MELETVKDVGLWSLPFLLLIKLVELWHRRNKPSEEVSSDTIKSLRETVDFEKKRHDSHEARIDSLEKALRDARIKEYQMLKILIRHLTKYPECSEAMKDDLKGIGIAA